MSETRLDLKIRPYAGQDENAVLDLLRESLGEGPTGRRTPAFFRWKHFANPFGASFMLVGEVDGRIVGLRAFMRWEFRCDNRTIRAVTAVDTATHPHYQGQGIFSKLTRTALDSLAGDADLVFNTPNEKSLGGYLKMGWQVAGRVPIRIRVRHPLKLALGLRSIRGPGVVPGREAPRVAAPRAAELLADSGVGSLIERWSAAETRIATTREGRYLDWRYAEVPSLDYRALSLSHAGRTRGLAIFRVRPRGGLWESTVTELIVEPGDRATASNLLRRVIAAASVDHLACHFPSGSTAARQAVRSGFVPSNARITFVVKPLNRNLGVDVTSLARWALSLGDVEVL
jgi:GNAT superfamily N-acetyltransferase